MSREHSRGKGSCTLCGRLAECPSCKQKTLHKVWGEYVCENHCSKSKRISEAFQREMEDALKKVE